MRRGVDQTDRRVVAHGRKSAPRRPRWRASPLANWFLVILAFDALMLALASGVVSSGNDAAGNGMVDALRQVLVQAGALLLCISAVLFLLVRRDGFRVSLTVMLALTSVLLPVLLR
jgi:hypothetical protein